MGYTRYLYNRVLWKNKSESLETPLGKTNLNRMDEAIYMIAENMDVVYTELSAGKFDEANAGKVITGVSWEEATGLFTMNFYDGTQFQIDFNIEKIPVSFSMDSAGVITMATSDGTQWTADIGELIPDYTFEDSDRIAFTRTKNEDGSYSVSADIRKNSITGEFMQPDYLADITAQASSAAASAKQASSSADAASYDAKMAQSYAVGTGDMRENEAVDNARAYQEQAQENAETAEREAVNASESAAGAASSAAAAEEKATAAEKSADAAKESETNAEAGKNAAAASAMEAGNSAVTAANAADTASQSAGTASDKAAEAESYAHGGTGTRENEDTDNAKFYYEQAKHISQGGNGLVPMGTVAFSQLPTADITPNAMYNVSDAFVSDERFQDGGGIPYGSGSNVYYTVDGMWDVLAASGVTGVKGSAESTYRQGNVNITPENIGLGNVDNTHDSEKDVSSARKAGSITVLRTDGDYDTLPGANTMTVREFFRTSEHAPSTAWYHVFTGQGEDANYQTQLAVGMTQAAVWYRNRMQGAWKEWLKLLDSSNYSSYALPLSGGTLKGNLIITNPNYPDARIELRVDNEGANIRLGSATSGLYYEMDTLNGGLRLYTYGADNTYRSLVSTSDNKLNINGNAATAAKATQDSSGNVITTTYATKTELNEIKKSVSDGKTLVANAITAKGVTTATDAAFQTMAGNIAKLETGANVDNLFNMQVSTYTAYPSYTSNYTTASQTNWGTASASNSLTFLGSTFTAWSLAFTTNLKEGTVGTLATNNISSITMCCIYDIASKEYHILPAGPAKDIYLSAGGLVRFTLSSAGTLTVYSLGSGVSQRANITCFFLK